MTSASASAYASASAFDRLYNRFFKYISKYKTLLSGSRRSYIIGDLNTQKVGEHECGYGRVRGRDHGERRGLGRGRGRGKGRGRGRGRGQNTYLLYCPYDNGNFIPEAKIYDKGQYQSFS